MITGGWSEEGREKEQSLQPPAAHGPQPRPPRVPARNRGGPGRAEPSWAKQGRAVPSRAKPQRSAGALQAAPASLLAGGDRSLGPWQGTGGRPQPRPPAPAPPGSPGSRWAPLRRLPRREPACSSRPSPLSAALAAGPQTRRRLPVQHLRTTFYLHAINSGYCTLYTDSFPLRQGRACAR